MAQCHAKTARGKRCKAKCVGKTKYCLFHQSRKSAAGSLSSSRTVTKSETPRIIRNQIAVRGAKIAGRALTSVGASAMGYSVVVGNRPTVNKTPLPMTKRKYRQNERLMRGSSRALDPDMKKYSFATKGMSDRGTAHYRRSQSRHARRKAMKVGALRGSGTLALFGGQVLPVIAYGYVAGQYIDLGTRTTSPSIRTDNILEDVTYLHTMNMSAVGRGIATARATMHVAKTAWNVIT